MLAAATLLQAELMDYDLEEKAQTVVALAQRLSEVANEP